MLKFLCKVDKNQSPINHLHGAANLLYYVVFIPFILNHTTCYVGVRVGDQYIYFSDLVIPRNALSEQTSPRKNILSTFTKAPSSSFSNTTTFTHPPSSQTNVSQICSSPSSTLLHLATRHVGGLTSGGWEGDGCVTVHSTPKSSYGDKGLHVKPGQSI